MEQRDSSGCLKRILMGCGCITIGVFAFVLFMGSWMYFNRQVTPEVVSLQASDSFEDAILEVPLSMPEGQQVDLAKVKPIRLRIEAHVANVQIRPGEPNGKITVDGDYDQANYEMIIKAEDRGEYIDYLIQLKSKRSFFGLVIDDSDKMNEFTITLPPNLLLDIDAEFKIGESEVDLSGLAVRSVVMDGRFGQVTMRMEEPNQVAMEKLNVTYAYGEARVLDLQNYRTSKVKTDMSFGSMRISNSGPIDESLDIKAEGSFGEVAFDLPENAKVDASASVVAGEFRGVPKDRDYLPEGAPQIHFRGDMSFGEMSVRQRSHGNDITTLVLKWIRNEGLNEAVANYQKLLKESPTKYNYSPDAINTLGYRLIRSSRTRELAIQVFTFNTLAHPYYANGFDSLGEGYLQIEEYQLALENYEMAYEMDPTNRHAYRIIQDLEAKINQTQQSNE